MPPSFENEVRSLRSDIAQQLYAQAEALGLRVERGGYDETDLTNLGYILKNIRDHLVGNDARLSEVIGIPGKTIAAAYEGRSRPKYTNFMKMLSGAKKILSDEIANPGSQNVNLGHDPRVGINEPTGQPGSTDQQIRIRSGKTNIFLSEADLALVQYSEAIQHTDFKCDQPSAKAARRFGDLVGRGKREFPCSRCAN